MKTFTVTFEATVGRAYIKAENIDEALEKLAASDRNVDTQDVRFDEWEPELLDVNCDDVEELTDPDEVAEVEEAKFGELP